MTEVSSTRLYLGNLPRNATKADVEAHFASHGTGEITEIKLMNGFGFIEYKDAMDARDVVPAFLLANTLVYNKDGSTFMNERLTVQFARGSRHRENGAFPTHERLFFLLFLATGFLDARHNNHRCLGINGNGRLVELDVLAFYFDMPLRTTVDLKDFARQSGCDVVYSETGRNANGEGFVEFETAADLKKAVEALDGRDFKDLRVTCVANTQPDMPPRDGRGRSRSPGARRPYPPRDDWDRRGPPPAGWSPRRDGYRDGYRDRSPRRDYYDDRSRYRSPPRRGPVDDYPPPRGRYDDPYRRDYPPPDPYMNGRGPYDRPPPRDFPPRDAGYPRDGGYPPRDYDRRYW
ncbi:hypothetical protein VMCG_03328 [Cytospora schulzeri]|uniref:RRM domain-containing protein n=1 Tax=Cytospora schulzeri TaxID=448051 RepID=A0A423WXH7_9PEZI|nr:hypothetical protein VMCG_03328 [Valsa malicola]